MEFKKATIQDVPLIIHFRKTQLIQNGAHKEDINDQEMIRFFENHFKNNTIYQIIAYDKDLAIATGSILFYEYPPSHVNQSGIIGYISNMYTLPQYRKQGIATSILSLLEKEAKERNVYSLTLNATVHGLSLYEKNGYHEGFLKTREKKLK